MDMNHPLLQANDEPAPFPASMPQLRRLDRVPVCPICKELYKGPVSIACGHSFCSECIRASLDAQKKCPSCNEPAMEGHIRRNRVLEEMADAWEAARPSILEMSQPRERERGRKRPRSGSVSPPSSVEIVELTPDDEGTCPICSARMAISSIPAHVERGCPPPKPKVSQKADWKKVFAGAAGKDKVSEMKRIVKPNYSLISTSELKGLLSEHSLPTTGDRPSLESRFQEWIVLFNANLDTSHPSSVPALRARLAGIEESRKRDKLRGREEGVEALKSREGLVKHAKEQKGEFERLKRDILARKGKKGQVDSPIEVE